MNCADNYPPGVNALPPDDKPVGKCEMCKGAIYPGDKFIRHPDMPICKEISCRTAYFIKYPDVISSYLEEIEAVAGAEEVTAGTEKL